MPDEDYEKSIYLGTVLSVWHSAVVSNEFKNKIAGHLNIKTGFFHPINRYRIHIETNAIAAGCAINKLGHVLQHDDMAFGVYLKCISACVNIPYAKIIDYDFYYTRKIFLYAKSLSGVMYSEACDILCSSILGNKALGVPFIHKTQIAMEILQLYSSLDEVFKESEYEL